MADKQPNQPPHDICFVEERGKDQKGYWTTIGAAGSTRTTTG